MRDVLANSTERPENEGVHDTSMGTHNLSMIGDMPIAQPNTLTLLAFFNLAIERGAGRIEVVRRAIDVATYLGAAIPINAVDGITAACLCNPPGSRTAKRRHERAAAARQTATSVAQAAARDKIQDEQANGAAGSSIVAGSTALSAQPTVEETLAEADSLAEAETIASLILLGHRSPSVKSVELDLREAPPRSAAPPSIPPSPPVMTPVSKQGHAQTPGTAPATTPTTHKRAESDAGLDDGEDLGASPGGPGRVLPRPLSTGVRKDEWTASFEGDTFVRRCNFNWVDENGNDLPNTAATVALRKNGDLLRGRSAPSKCDRLNIE